MRACTAPGRSRCWQVCRSQVQRRDHNLAADPVQLAASSHTCRPAFHCEPLHGLQAAMTCHLQCLSTT